MSTGCPARLCRKIVKVDLHRADLRHHVIDKSPTIIYNNIATSLPSPSPLMVNVNADKIFFFSY
jgi:hypothetical protein